MKKRYLILIIILIAILAFAVFYVNDYYHADSKAISLLENKDVKVSNTSNGLFLDGYGNDTALIFYPGAKVEYTSYSPIMMELAENGVDCYLVEMPFNLAFLGQNIADDIINQENYTHYFIAGHSLGGAMAASYVNETNNTDGLILLASYPTSEIEKPVLSIYGSNDKVLNAEKYMDSKDLMDNLTEIVIENGNHAQFGDYGNQSGDGVAKISAQSQQDQCAKAILDFIKEIE